MTQGPNAGSIIIVTSHFLIWIQGQVVDPIPMKANVCPESSLSATIPLTISALPATENQLVRKSRQLNPVLPEQNAKIHNLT